MLSVCISFNRMVIRIPALAFTALAGDNDRREALAAGFQMHVPKPVDAEHLLRVVGQLAKQGANVR
ncbi:MAG: hypothetical protein IPK60_00060 [Sandaracinaceae bacterium]|nr:hypothetical protein [Sandaracinaceae bacterium]